MLAGPPDNTENSPENGKKKEVKAINKTSQRESLEP